MWWRDGKENYNALQLKSDKVRMLKGERIREIEISTYLEHISYSILLFVMTQIVSTEGLCSIPVSSVGKS